MIRKVCHTNRGERHICARRHRLTLPRVVLAPSQIEWSDRLRGFHALKIASLRELQSIGSMDAKTASSEHMLMKDDCFLINAREHEKVFSSSASEHASKQTNSPQSG